MIRLGNSSTISTVRQAISNFVHDEGGATAVEYALLASLIGVAIIGATTKLGSQVGAVFTAITGKLNTWAL